MTAAWQLELAEIHCRVEWRKNQLAWQISHPNAPNGQTRLSPIGAMTVNGQPVQWTRLVGAQETLGPHAAPRLVVTLEDSAGCLRLVRHFELFAGHAFARTWGAVEYIGNEEDELPLLDGAAILHLAVDADLSLIHI